MKQFSLEGSSLYELKSVFGVALIFILNVGKSFLAVVVGVEVHEDFFEFSLLSEKCLEFLGGGIDGTSLEVDVSYVKGGPVLRFGDWLGGEQPFKEASTWLWRFHSLR